MTSFHHHQLPVFLSKLISESPRIRDPELAVNARHLATRRAHPAFKFFTSLIPEAESFNLESFVPATTGGLEEHMLPPQMSG
jgi:hypothetical protein